MRDFKTLRIVSETRLEDGIITSSNHQTMNIIALGLDNGTIVAFDLELNKIVRIFKSDSTIANSIADLVMSFIFWIVFNLLGHIKGLQALGGCLWIRWYLDLGFYQWKCCGCNQNRRQTAEY